MKLSVRHIIALMMVVACCTGCFNAGKQIDIAERLLEEQPDSAMRILDSFTVDDIFFNDDKARYALLYAEAQDKNFINETSDSLIRIAVDLYNIDGTPQQLFMSLYYWGRIQYNAGNYYTALATFTEAEQLVPHIDNHRMIGLLYSQIGDIYSLYLDYAKSLQAFKKAYTHYDKADLPRHRNYALIDLGISYKGLNHSDSCNIVLKKALNNAVGIDDSSQVRVAGGTLIVSNIENKDYKSAIHIFEQIKEYDLLRHPRSGFLGCLALLFTHCGDSIKSNEYIDRALNIAETKEDTIHIYYIKSEISEYRCNYKNAYYELQKGHNIETALVLKKLEQPVLTAQRDFLSSELELKKRDLQRSRTLYIVSTLLFIAISVIVIILLYRRYRRNRERLNEYAEIVAELQESLQSQQGKSELIQELFSNKYSIINNLGGLFADLDDTKQLGKQMVSEVKSMIEKFGKDKALRELNALIDKYCDNAITLLHQEMPQLSNVEYRQISYHYAGFSVKLIGLIMNENTMTIYKRRDRIKEKIDASTVLHKELFLSLFK